MIQNRMNELFDGQEAELRPDRSTLEARFLEEGERGKSEWQLTREVNPDCPVGPCHSPFNSGGPNPEEKFEEFDESSVEHTDRTFRWRDYDLSHEFLSLIRLSHLSHG